MDSKEMLTLDDGHPDIWKVQEGETPLEALERFFKAFDESFAARASHLFSASPSALGRATCQNQDELAALKTKLADTKTKLADAKTKLADLEIEFNNLNRQIMEKKLEGGRLRITANVWSSLCAAKVLVANKWKDAGLIAGEEMFLFATRLAGITDHELHKAIEAHLKEKSVVEHKATEENGSEQHGENSKARGTDGQ